MKFNSLKNVDLRSFSADELQRVIDEKNALIDKAYQDLNQARNDLTEFSYAVSHNLRGPVSSILGAFELIDRDKLDPFTQRLFDIIRLKAELADGIIHDLNQIVSLQRSVRSVYQLVEFNTIAREVLNDFGKEIVQNHIDVQIRSDQLDSFLTSKESLYNIFHQIIDNAIKFQSRERTSEIKIHATQIDDKVLIKINDNGIGFDPSNVSDRLFKAYERLHPKQSGKGLGLYLAQQQAQMLGGNISIHSHPNKGTEVTLTLPLIHHIEKRVLLESELVRFVYFPTLRAIKAVWKRTILADEFDELFRFILDFVLKYKTTSWIADIRQSPNDEISLNTVRERFKKRISEVGLQRMAIIVNEDEAINGSDPRRIGNVQRTYPFPVAVFTSLQPALDWIESENMKSTND